MGQVVSERVAAIQYQGKPLDNALLYGMILLDPQAACPPLEAALRAYFDSLPLAEDGGGELSDDAHTFVLAA